MLKFILDIHLPSRKKIALNAILLFSVFTIDAQIKDTIVIKDMTLTLLEEVKGNYQVVSNVSLSNNVIFKLPHQNSLLRICSENNLSLWRNDQLIKKVIGCELVVIDSLLNNDSTVFRLVATEYFSNLKLELLDTEMDKTIKQPGPILRQYQTEKKNFSVLVSLVVLALLAILSTRYTIRIKNIWRVFYFTKNEIKGFYEKENIVIVVFISLMISFPVTIFYDYVFEYNLFNQFITSYIKSSILIFVLINLKNFWSFTVAWILNVKSFYIGITNDFINFLALLTIPIWVVLTQLNLTYSNNRGSFFNYLDQLGAFVILIFNLLLVFKLVASRNSEKIRLFAYLCASEFIPAYYLVAWFFKYI